MLKIDDMIDRFDGSIGYATNSKEICQYIADLLKELKERRKQPEIIRCKDCADWGTNNCAMSQAVDYNPDYDWTNPDGYCHMAERRIDDKTNKGSSC